MNFTKEDRKNNPHEGHRARLRQKFDADPDMKSSLDYEMLEYVLSLVIPRKDTNVIAHDLIAKFGTLHGVFTADVESLKEVKNMTTSAAYLLAAMYPVVRRSLRDKSRDDKVDIDSPVKCAEYLQPAFIGRKTECLLVVFLDVDCRVINSQWIEGAHPSHLKIDVTGIAKLALKNGASYALIAHNHPSGNLAPSKEDINETSKLFAAMMSVEIRLVDSFIFSDSGFFSFRNNGLMASMESEWFRHKTSRANLQNPQHYNFVYTSDLAEFLLDFGKMRDKGTLEVITKEEYVERLKRENKKPER